MHGLSRLSAWWVALGIDLERGRPGIPRTTERTNACIAISVWNCIRCCDVTDLYQAFSQRTGPGAIMDKSERLCCCSFWVHPNPQIHARLFTQANNLKTCNL